MVVNDCSTTSTPNQCLNNMTGDIILWWMWEITTLKPCPPFFSGITCNMLTVVLFHIHQNYPICKNVRIMIPRHTKCLKHFRVWSCWIMNQALYRQPKNEEDQQSYKYHVLFVLVSLFCTKPAALRYTFLLYTTQVERHVPKLTRNLPMKPTRNLPMSLNDKAI